MDIEDLYKLKTSETEYKNNLSLLNLFKSEDNINELTYLLYNENYLSNNLKIFNDIKKLVNQYVNAWIELGKFDNIEDTADTDYNKLYIQLRYYNKLFINTFSNYIVKYDLFQHELINNPYKHKFTINNTEKTMADFQADDYQYLNTSNYNDKFTLNNQFKENYNHIPQYEKWIYNKHYDRKDSGSLRDRALENMNYKKYDNTELYNNIDYLKK